MGLLIEILFDFIPWGAAGRRRVRKVLREGRPLIGRIDAHKVTEPSQDDSWPRHYVGVSVDVDGVQRRAAVRGQLWPMPEEARLGSEVCVRELKGRIAIDWAATLRRRGFLAGDVAESERLLRKPIRPGVDDGRLNRRRLRKGERVEARLTALEQQFARLGGATGKWNLELRAEDGTPLTIRNAFVPEYVRHMLLVGTPLPVAVQGKRLAVDWPEAAAREAAMVAPGLAPLAAAA